MPLLPEHPEALQLPCNPTLLKHRTRAVLGFALAGFMFQASAQADSANSQTGSAASAVMQSEITSAQPRKPTGFYTIGMKNGRWTFFDPGGKTYFCLGLNHLSQRFGGGRIDRDLASYHFNSYGWMASQSFIK
jgi:hypothetical protein